MHSGFSNLRSALPMNLKAHYTGFKIWAGALPDIERICDDLARVPRRTRRTVSVRREAVHGRRHVRAGVHALPHLRRGARRDLRRLLRGHHGDAADAGVDRRGAKPSRRNWKSSTSSSSSRSSLFQLRAGTLDHVLPLRQIDLDRLANSSGVPPAGSSPIARTAP